MKKQKLFQVPLVLLLVLSTILVSVGSGQPTNPPPFGQSPTMWVDDSAAHFNTTADLVCTYFNVSINIWNTTVGVGVWDFKLSYNTTLLDAEYIYGYDGSIPDSSNCTDWGPGDMGGVYHPDGPPPINDTAGYVWTYALFPYGQEFTGSGTMCKIKFHITLAPAQLVNMSSLLSCDFHLYDTRIGDYIGDPISHGTSDGVYSYNRIGVVPGAPTPAFTWSPPSPYEGDTVNFDASASTDGGFPPLTYNWDLNGDGVWGDASTVNPSYTYMTAGTYEVGLNVTNGTPVFMSAVLKKNVTVTKPAGALIDVWTQDYRQYPEGTTTPFDGKGVGADCDSFAPGENVSLWALVTYNGELVQNILVGFEVFDPLNRCVTYRVDATDVIGIAQVWFRVPIPCSPAEQLELFGHWTVIAKCKLQDDIINDTMHFKVGFIVEVIDVETVGTSDFYKCNTIQVNITVKNIGWVSRNVTLIAVVYDECDVPIGQAVLKFEIAAAPAILCSEKVVTQILEIHVPKWAYVGKANVFVNAFTELPRNCGIPYCPEVGYPITILKTI